MCIVSNIGDGWSRDFGDRYPWVKLDDTAPYKVNPLADSWKYFITPEVSIEDFEKLKNEVEELKKLLIAAKIFDEKTGQKDCENDKKVEMIKKIAEMVGVNVDEVFK